MVNTDTEQGSDNNGKAVIEEILSENGYDMTKKKASVDSNYTLSFDNATDSDIATLQVLSALFGIGDLDLFVSDKEVFDKFAVKNGFSDLRAFISSDILSANEDKIYYFEKENGESVPIAIILEDGSVLHKEGLYEKTVYCGIVSRAENADTAADIIKSLLIVQN